MQRSFAPASELALTALSDDLTGAAAAQCQVVSAAQSCNALLPTNKGLQIMRRCVGAAFDQRRQPLFSACVSDVVLYASIVFITLQCRDKACHQLYGTSCVAGFAEQCTAQREALLSGKTSAECPSRPMQLESTHLLQGWSHSPLVVIHMAYKSGVLSSIVLLLSTQHSSTWRSSSATEHSTKAHDQPKGP